MRTLLSLWLPSLFLLSLSAAPLCAQEHPKFELFGGYSYIHADTDGRLTVDLNQFGGPAVRAKVDNAHLHGWTVALAANPTGWLGFVADVSGNYGDAATTLTDGVSTLRVGVPLRVHNFLFGPQLTYRRDNVSIFGRALVGVSRLDIPLKTAVPSAFGSVGETAFATAVGGGLDIKLTDRLWARAIQADALITRYHKNLVDRGTQVVPRLATGLVVRDK